MEPLNVLPFENFKPFFLLEEKDNIGLNFRAKCLLCVPFQKLVGASTTSSSNLRKHLKNSHSSMLSKLTSEKSGKKTPRTSEPDGPDQPPKKRQARLEEFQQGRPVNQEAFDKLVVSFIVKGLHSFSVVESVGFRALVKGMAPDKNVMCRSTLMKRIEVAASSKKDELVKLLEKLNYVATTADSWKVFNRSYLGVTIHWLDETLSRKMTVLACRRIIGSQTHDVLARYLAEINSEFGIQNKVVSTTTDNGSNFVKAFRVYGQPLCEGDEVEGDEEFVEIEQILAEVGDTVHLPSHERCVAHTMNLVAAVDATKANQNCQYKRLSRTAIALCQALWNKQSGSSLQADIVKEKLGVYLITPNATRWNSLYDSLEHINKIAKEKLEEFQQMLDQLGLKRFSQDDIKFIAEYCKVMKPVATALDFLQAEKSAYMGVLLPTLHALRRRLVSLKEGGGVKACEPLIIALIEGIDTRFSDQWFRKDLVLAACLHPHYVFKWMKDTTKEDIARGWLEEEVRCASPSILAGDEESEEDEDGLFDFAKPGQSGSGSSNELEKFLNFPIAEVAELTVAAYPILRKLFIKFNTPIPSSAGVERVFSTGGLIFTDRRGKMSDVNFERCLRLKIGL